MISLHSMLAGGIASQLPLIYAVFGGIVLAVAFLVGFVKGFRKVSWGGLTWLTAGGVFLLASRAISMEGSVTRKFVYAFLIALLVIASVLALYGILAFFLRPKIRWVKDDVNGDTSLAEYGLEFEPEYLDYDGENDLQPYGKRIYKTGFNPPSFVGRLLGGISCVVNAAMILWTIASVALLCITTTSLATAPIGVVMGSTAVAKLAEFASNTLLDMLTIGIVILVAKKGYTNGLLNSLRVILITAGSLGGIVGCFYLAFGPAASNTEQWYYVSKLVSRCVSVCSKAGPMLADPLGKALAGVCMSAVVVVLMILLNILLKKCCRFVSSNAPTRTVDLVLSCILYMIIGAAICIGGWFVLATFDYVGILNISEALSEGSHLSNGIFGFVEKLVDKLLGPHFGS